VLHTGRASRCIGCHGAPNATPPVFYNSYTPKSAVLAPVHIPTGATPCEDCHTATGFTSFAGTGGTTMTSAKHTAMFAFIGSTCDACHNKVTPPLSFYGVTNLQVRPNSHNSGRELTGDCSGCHNTNGWGGGAAKGKSTAAAQTTVRGKVGIIVTPRTLAPEPGNTFQLRAGRAAVVPSISGRAVPAALPSHFGVTSNCVSCHNGTLATGKGPAHIATSDACQNCHTTAAWLPARFEHQGVQASCVSCHNGALAPGKPAHHIQTTQDCGACHNPIDWRSVTFSHVGASGACQSCHNGITATGKRIQHVITTQDCGSCHNTSSWTITSPAKSLQPLIRGRRGGGAGGPNGPQR
jgi:hypothetical protein